MADPAARGADLTGIPYAIVWKPDGDLFSRMPDLEVIFSGGAGIDSILAIEDLPKVPVVRFVDHTLTTRMSEWVVLQCLSHLRQVHRYAAQQKARIWRELPQPEASEVTVGLMGLGVLGQDAAAKLRMMGFRVIGWSRTRKAIDGIESFDASGLDDFLARTDILVGLLPLTAETTRLYDASLFARLRQNGPLGRPVFINAGRGKSQAEDDIVAALRSGLLGGASLDVFSVEPFDPASPLWDMENVIITPHAAAASDEKALMRHVETQIGRYEAGKPLEFVADAALGY